MEIDDEPEPNRQRARPPKLTNAEPVTLVVARALPAFRSEARRLRYARPHLVPMFPYPPQ
ncbi:hypothetical protein ACFVTP_32600 [Streptomyces celluloflavus]|uniref:hypothetical protein n=1 Tax=Streptomyces celluloflavus TaxID=58344 RepID=UPI0036DC5F91